MNLELKKYKITSSIINQTLLGSYKLFYNSQGYDILGWCLVKKLRYYVLQNRETKQLLKLPYVENNRDLTFKKVGVQIPDEDGGYRFPYLYLLKAHAKDFRNTFLVYHQSETESDEYAEGVFNKTKDFIFKANQIGQFYL
jgi:hypothetical protein